MHRFSLVQIFILTIISMLLLAGCSVQTPEVAAPTAVSTAPSALAPPTAEVLAEAPALTGKVVYHTYAGDALQISVVDLATGEIKQLTSEGDNSEPRWSPDGTQIAFTCKFESHFEICVMNEDGSNIRRLTNNTFDDFSPNWSPDGKLLAYVSTEVPFAHLYIYDLESGTSRRLLNAGGNEGAPRWSPDGSRILYMSDRVGYNLYSVKPDGSDEQQITKYGHDDRPAWSPDGKLIAFRREVVISPMFSGVELIVADANGKNALQLTSNTIGEDWAEFSPDSKWIVYTASATANGGSLRIIPVIGGTAAPLIAGEIAGSAPDWKP